MRIFLVRHGESEGNVGSNVYKTKADHAIELSPTGREQANGAGRFLANWFNLERDTHMRREKAWTPPRLWVSLLHADHADGGRHRSCDGSARADP